MLKLGICYTIVSVENKWLIEAAEKRGVEVEKIMDSEVMLDLVNPKKLDVDVVLERSASYYRGLYLAYNHERMGARAINNYNAMRICGDKMLCSIELAKSGVPTPKTFVAFTPESAKACVEKMGFPVVMKPVMGSWARMVHKINDRDALEAEIEAKEEMGSPLQKVYYIQEHIDKPGRDIRAVVVGDEVIYAIYRIATPKSGWVTNTSRGGLAKPCKVTPELSELCLKATDVVGEGVYGVDLMETKNGFVVHEINHNIDFRNSVEASGIDVPGKIIDYVIKSTRK